MLELTIIFITHFDLTLQQLRNCQHRLDPWGDIGVSNCPFQLSGILSLPVTLYRYLTSIASCSLLLDLPTF